MVYNGSLFPESKNQHAFNYLYISKRTQLVDMELLNKILYALPVYQSAALAFLLFMNGSKHQSRARILMGVFQLLCVVYFSFNLAYAIHWYDLLLALYYLILPVILLFLPLFYLYLLAITTPGFRFNRSHLSHFIPSGIFLVANTPFLFAEIQEKLGYLSHGFNSEMHSGLIFYLTLVYVIGIFGFLPLQLLYYFSKAIKLYRRHKNYIQDHYSYTENISLNWILALMVSLVLFFLSNQMLYLFGFHQGYFSPVFYNTLMLIITLFAGYSALSQKDLKSLDAGENKELSLMAGATVHTKVTDAGQSGIAEPESEVIYSGNIVVGSEEKETETPLQTGTSVSSKYAGSPLSEHRKVLIINRLDMLMKVDKIFTNDKLSVEDVAGKLETNTKYVSQVINERYGKNFYNYINTYRVEEAQKLLLSGGWERYSMLGIALMVGFGSKSSFNASFKKITGLTPSEYVKANN
jgi:AraC-like DNA-binding protein